ncbi:MAG: alpha/beta hydrolase [Verrucomicrobiales bacterium]
MKKAFFSGVLLWSLLTLCLGAAEKADELRVYKEVDGVKLKIHVFKPEGHAASDQRPAIVFFFGGGWTGGSPAQFFPHCRYLASRGMVAMAADYRVRSRHKTTPRECVMDGNSALRWLRRNAADWGVDPEKIAAGGGSAGGQVAAATALAQGFEEAGEDQAVSSRPDLLVLFNPVYDNGPEGYGYERVKDYWREFSPLHNVDEKAPPTIVFLGTQDDLIPVATAQTYQKRMEEAGVDAELHLYEGEKHGFFNAGKKRKIYEDTLVKMDRFLVKHGFLAAKKAASDD